MNTNDFQLGIIGLLLNALAIILIYRMPQLRNSFGILMASRCLASAGVLGIFAVWGAPITLT
jgi:hypothetical protein